MKNTLLKDSFANDQMPSYDQLPELLLDHQEFNYPKEMNCGWYLLDRWVEEGLGKKNALNGYSKEGEAISLNYQQVLKQSNQIANYLTNNLGLVSGNRVLLHSFNNVHMAICWLACVRAGIIVVAAMPMLKAVELKKIIDKSEIKAALVDSEIVTEAQKCLDKTNEDCFSESLKYVEFFNSTDSKSLENKISHQSDAFSLVKVYQHDICLIAFTSGTTGMPKGCVHFHRDIVSMSICVGSRVLHSKPSDIFCGTPPLAFTFGLGGLLSFPLYHSAATLLVEKPSPEVLLKAIEDFKVTTLFTSPTFYKRLAMEAKDYDISSLRTAVSAGEKLPTEIHKLWLEKTGIEMVDGIGATEMIHIFISNTKKDIKMGSIGKPVFGYEAAIFDESGKKLKAYETGALAIKGPTGCKYLADERQNVYVKNGWNFTGDLAYVDEGGYYFYQGRSDDMIISSGYNISGVEVEDALLKYPLIEECAVVGAPNEQRGSIVKAYIVLKDKSKKSDALVKEIQDFIKSTIAPYKYPRAIEFMDALPKTATGKIQRKQLRSMNQ